MASKRTARDSAETGIRKGTAQAAIKQTAPFRSACQEALINLLLTSDALRWQIGTLLASKVEGLTMPQYNALRILRGAGKSGLPTLEIGERMMERTPGVTRMLDRLEAKGYVERERSTEDRRQVICRLSAEGARVLKKLDRPIDANDEKLFGGLEKREVRELTRLLEKMRNGIAPAD